LFPYKLNNIASVALNAIHIPEKRILNNLINIVYVETIQKQVDEACTRTDNSHQEARGTEPKTGHCSDNC
jgi:hypothetical protein